MRATIRRWGNSLAVLIPKDLVEEAGLRHNDQVDISFSNRKLLVTPESEPTFGLEELLAGVTPDNLHGEWDTG